MLKGVKMEESDMEICEECKIEINCNRSNIYIITKEDKDKVLCNYCFIKLWKEYYNDGWLGDDIEYFLELEKEETKSST